MPSLTTRTVAGAVLALLAAPAAAYSPATNYALHCQGCHLDDGREVPATVPPLRGAGRFLRVPGGREFLVRVPGVSQSSLDDATLAELLNWLLHRFSPDELPASFAAYTADEIGRLRRHPLTDVDGVRRGLIEALGR
jgi:hypothetical protein